MGGAVGGVCAGAVSTDQRKVAIVIMVVVVIVVRKTRARVEVTADAIVAMSLIRP